MVRFTAIVLLTVAALSEARNLKGTKSGKAYKGTDKSNYPVQVGARAYYVVDSMEASPLKEKLTKFAETTETFTKSDWSTGHRGAGLMESSFRVLDIYLCRLFLTVNSQS